MHGICCHVWAGAPSCYLELLGKLQKLIWRTWYSLVISLEPLDHHQNVTSLSLFYRFYVGRCSSELAELFPLPYSWGRSICYSDRLHGFSVTIARYYNDIYVNSFIPRTARLWNSLPIECSPLTYDLNGFKSRINRHLFTVRSFERNFLYALIFLCFVFFLIFLFPCLVVNSLACSKSQLKNKQTNKQTKELGCSAIAQRKIFLILFLKIDFVSNMAYWFIEYTMVLKQIRKHYLLAVIFDLSQPL